MIEPREGLVAAILFVLTSLMLPLAFAPAGQGGAQDRNATRFHLSMALFQLRADEITRTMGDSGLATPAEDETQSQIPAKADGEVQASSYALFLVEDWVSATADHPVEDRDRLLKQVAVAALAFGRDHEARSLLKEAEVLFADQEPLAYLFSEREVNAQVLRQDLEQTLLPGVIQELLVKRYSEDSIDGIRASIQADVTAYSGRIGSMVLAYLLVLVAGLVVLVRSGVWLRRFSTPRSDVALSRFQARPMQTFLLFLLWMLILFSMGTLVSQALSGHVSGATNMMLTYVATAVAGVYLVRTMGYPRASSLLDSVDLDVQLGIRRPVAMGIAGYLAAVPVVLLLGVVSAILFGGGAGAGLSPAIPFLAGSAGAAERWIVVGTVVILAPLFEEFFFRGFLFQQFRSTLGTTHAILLSALVFAAVHLSIESFLPLFGLGVILGLVYHHTQSLWASILTHALWNAATSVMVMTVFD